MREGMRAFPPRWQWACGFYPASSDLSEHAHGMAESFDQARGAFKAPWRNFLATRTEVDFEEYRRDRAFHAGKQAMWATGLQLPSRLPTGGHNASAARRSALRMWRATLPSMS
jgi:hypothetical protein